VDNISFVVKEGELFAFLGINGAGKSTTINIISGSLEKDTGEVYIDNKNIDGDHIAFKSKIGIVFQNSVLDKNLSVKDNLTLRAGLYGMPKTAIEENIKKVSELFELKELLKRKIKTLSGGQRRRVDIARALIHNPKILIMDEPTTGLDPQTRSLLWDVIAKLRENGLSVFLTTHYMEEAANADYVIIIDEGKIVAKGTPLRLKQTYAHDTFSIYVDDKEALLEKLINDGYQVFKTSNGININIENTSFAKEIIKKYSAEIFDFEVLKGDMNSVFLNITGKDLRGE
jgi:multidrug/hemolysin transport system ATP-binding protein